MKQQKELDKAKKIYLWDKRALILVGLWPQNASDIVYFVTFSYFMYLMTMEYVDLILFFGDLEHVIINLSENLSFTTIVSRLFVVRIYNSHLKRLIDDFMGDFSADKYESVEETATFLKYNAKSRIFVRLMTLNLSLTAVSYFMKPFLDQMGYILQSPAIENGTMTFELPYRFYLFYPLNDVRTYLITYASWVPFVVVCALGCIGPDCLMITLVYHLAGQMAVLSIRVKNLPDSNSAQDRKKIRNTVKHLIKLLRMGRVLQKSFSIILFADLVCTSISVCILGFEILLSLAMGDVSVLITLMIYLYAMLLALFLHCTVGECLITESARVCRAFCECNWYKMPQDNATCILMCIMRTQTPLCLSAGDFGIFNHRTVTNVLKTSMSYLSVLKELL